MDHTLAEALTRIFQRAGTEYPHLLGEAQISLRNGGRTQHQATVPTPAEAASILQLYSSNSGPFALHPLYGLEKPLTFTMDQRLKRQNANPADITPPAAVRALTLSFRDFTGPSHMYVAGLGHGFMGPALPHMIEALTEAGQNWSKVNFIRRAHGAHLRSVAV